MSERPTVQPTDPDSSLIETSAGSIAVAEEGPGNGAAVLCVHGIPGSSRDFRYLAPLLARRMRVVRAEMPGFGASPPGSVASVAGWGRVLLAVAEALGLDRPVLLGHSFGGGAVVQAARAGGGAVAGVALLAPMGARRHAAFAMPPVAYRWIALALRVPPVRPLLLPVIRRGYTSAGLQPPPADDWRIAARHVALLGSVSFADQARAAAEIIAPALLFQAADDRIVQPAITRDLAARLRDARLVEFPDGGHHLVKTRAADVAAAILQRFARD